MSSNGNNTILWLLGGAVAGWYLFLRDDDDDDKRVRLPVTGVLRAWAEEAGRFDLVSEIADIEHEWANRDPDENEDEVAGLLNARLKAVEQVLDDDDAEAEELLRDRREDYRLRGAGKRRSNPSPSAPKIRHRDLGTGVVLDFDYADDGSLLCFVAWTAQRGTGGGWYDLTSGPFRTDDAAAFKAFYEDWRLQRNPSRRAGSKRKGNTFYVEKSGRDYANEAERSAAEDFWDVPVVRHPEFGPGVVLDFAHADDGSLLADVMWTARRGSGAAHGWYNLTSGPVRADDAAALKASYSDWQRHGTVFVFRPPREARRGS